MSVFVLTLSDVIGLTIAALFVLVLGSLYALAWVERVCKRFDAWRKRK